MSTREWLPIVQHDDWQTGHWDQRENEELLQKGHLQRGSEGSQCQKADPRWNMPSMVEFFWHVMIDWEDGKVFFSSRYLKSDPILGYCLPLTMHTEDKTEKVRISLFKNSSSLIFQLYRTQSSWEPTLGSTGLWKPQQCLCPRFASISYFIHHCKIGNPCQPHNIRNLNPCIFWWSVMMK